MPASETSPPYSRRIVRDDIAYILPMGVFMALTWAGGHWAAFFPASYVLKTILVAGLLIYLWPNYTRIRWNHWWLGVLVGSVSVVQWVGMEKLILHFWPGYPRMSLDIYDPTQHFSSPQTMWAFIAIRWAGATLLVPVMEELFWRDFAWRTIIAPNDFKLAGVGEWDTKAFWFISLIFCTVHIQWMTAIVWAMMIGWLLVYTKSLGACIIAHGVTNFLLGAFVLYSHFVLHHQEWYFW